MYELLMDRLEAAGYEHYEISNWGLSPSLCKGRGNYGLTVRSTTAVTGTRHPISASGLPHTRTTDSVVAVGTSVISAATSMASDKGHVSMKKNGSTKTPATTTA